MNIQRNGSTPSAKPPEEYFTGTVRLDSPFQGDAPSRIGGAIVTFEPGARTAWHTHPLGQTLFVVSVLGWAQREGGEIEEIRPGDIVWFPPGEKHWHGATPSTAMSHIAIAEKLDGKSVEWMEKVSDELLRAIRLRSAVRSQFTYFSVSVRMTKTGSEPSIRSDCLYLIFGVHEQVAFSSIMPPNERDPQLVGTWIGKWSLLDEPELQTRTTVLRSDGKGCWTI